ncbi:MAG: DUF1329 domain-containing protein [Candidatus Binatia bacterium]
MKPVSSARTITFLSLLAATLLYRAAAAEDMNQKRLEEIGLDPETTLSAENAHLAEGWLPPEILDAYRKGEWKNQIVAWPNGANTYSKEFVEGTKRNGESLDVADDGGIVDKRTGKQPEHILGYPFPNIDPKDPKVGIKVYWNFLYMYYNVGNSRNFVDLVWVSRQGVDRVAGQEVYFFYNDAQKEAYLPKSNPLNLLQQFIATTTHPADLYGTTALQWRYRDPGKRDSNWAYVPALRRVRALSPANRSDGFLGSEMSQDDGPFFDGKPEDFEWKLVGEAQMLRIVDPYSMRGETERTALPEGGWRSKFKPGPIAGFEDPSWKGVPWAPVGPALAKRDCWIIEAIPKDRYYLYGKVQLYIDKETFQGAWNRKFSWDGELLNTYMPTGFLNAKSVAPDGAEEWFWGSALAYQAAINVKMDRATVTGFPLKNRESAVNDRRMMYEPGFFDYQTLYRFGK